MAESDDYRFRDYRELVNAQLQRIEDVLTMRVQILQVEVDRLKAQVKRLEEARYP
jgi:uncharacterized small protein (DUF1192 family)